MYLVRIAWAMAERTKNPRKKDLRDVNVTHPAHQAQTAATRVIPVAVTRQAALIRARPRVSKAYIHLHFVTRLFRYIYQQNRVTRTWSGALNKGKYVGCRN